MLPVGNWCAVRARRRALLVSLVATALVLLGQAGQAAAARDAAGAAGAGCTRPYTDDSPWNTAIALAPVYAADGASRVAQITESLTSDPSQFTYPVYEAAKRGRASVVRVFDALSRMRAGGAKLVNTQGGTLRIPLPKNARPTAETGQLIVVDSRTGREWGAFGLGRRGKAWSALFAYAFSTKTNGVPAIGNDGAGIAARAGASYLAGLIRACEITRGQIDHAVALAYDSPSIAHIAPLRGTNGTNGSPAALPVGARLQLDPTVTEAELSELGCRRACYTIARAMQQYGAFVVGRSGRPKIYVEHNLTARWKGAVRSDTVSAIPVERLRVLDLTDELRITKKFKRTKVRAGKVLTASMELAPAAADTGASGRVFCHAAVGENRSLKPLKAVTTARPSGHEQALCRWRVPAGLRGKTIDFSFQVVYQHGGVRNDFSARVTR